MNTLRWIVFIPLALLAAGAVTNITAGMFTAIPIGFMLDTGHLIAYGVIDAACTCLYMWIGMMMAPKKGIRTALALTTFLMTITLILFIILSAYANFHLYSTLIGRIVGSIIWYSYYLSKPKTNI